MEQIDKLNKKIADLEELAGALDETTADYYKDLYALLSEAYFASKDINALLRANLPVVKDNSSEVPLRDADATIETLNAKVFELQAWQDGANLEGEVLRKRDKELTTYIENMKEQAVKDSNLHASALGKETAKTAEAENALYRIHQIVNGAE